MSIDTFIKGDFTATTKHSKHLKGYTVQFIRKHFKNEVE